jgi:redox-sensitive bicupin YhaK (pirin superfamily)
MTTIRPAADRGQTRIGWLDSRHTFSFADYHDARHTGFRSLRVINDDRIAGGGGFDMHPHRDMEIVTVVLEGRLAHRDSMGHASTLGPGGVQRMSAGTGVFHSEHNPDPDAPLHLLQIWIHPVRRGIAPAYAEGHFDAITAPGPVRPIVDPAGQDGALGIQQDARILVAHLAPGQHHTHAIASGRSAWVHVYRGALRVHGEDLAAGDAMALEDEPEAVRLEAGEQAGAALIFDLA